jgi:biopolymer transport protein ExbB/TolQ
MGSVISFITEGGPFMYAISILLVVASAFVLERFVALYFNYHVKNSFFQRIRAMVKDGRIREAYNRCLSTSHPLARVIAAVLYNAKSSQAVIESASDIEVQKVLPGIQARTTYINMIGNVSTLVGLLGTIQGLVLSFQSLDGASGAEKASLLAKGISTAMNTTAFGLIVAIPCIIAYTILISMEDKILKKYDEIISEMIHLVVHKPHEEVVNSDTQFKEFNDFKKHG